jgi:dTDP-4-dehydrorhamnose 3,5-epimerase
MKCVKNRGSNPDSSELGAKEAILGVSLRPLAPAEDLRGSLCEVHRDGWELAPRPVQWDLITTKPRVLRGVHVHRLRYDYMIAIQGTAIIGLTDIRRRSPSFRRGMTIEVAGDRPRVVIVPPGVAHGIYTPGPMLYLYGLTNYYDGQDQLGCRFDDPALGIAWPDNNPIQLPRDTRLPDLDVLLRQFEAAGGVGDGL